MSETYSVVMTGKIADGFELAQVKANVSKLFKLSDGQVEKMFSGKPVAIRRGVEKEQALKLSAVLVKSGALAVVKASAPVAEQPKPKVVKEPQPKTKVVKEPQPKPSAGGFSPDINCPRCGHQQGFVTACGMCKMDMTLHIQRLKRKEQARANRLRA